MCSVVWELLSVCCVACQMKIVFIILLLYDVLYDGCMSVCCVVL